VEANRFEVIFSPPAQREMEGLAINVALQLARDIKSYLETWPFPFGKKRIKKLTGFIPPLYRLRSGDFRIYYRVLSKEVVLLAVTHKKDSEKFLKKLR
jgi:mRNA-degrading endonuclease RelE of RelBE toxin-antitoxin system